MMIGSAGSPSGGTPPNTRPSPASFIMDSSDVVNPSTTVNFSDSSPNTPTSWSWKVNGAEFAITKNSSYFFSSVGEFDIELTATNFFGSDSVTHHISVQLPGSDS